MAPTESEGSNTEGNFKGGVGGMGSEEPDMPKRSATLGRGEKFHRNPERVAQSDSTNFATRLATKMIFCVPARRDAEK